MKSNIMTEGKKTVILSKMANQTLIAFSMDPLICGYITSSLGHYWSLFLAIGHCEFYFRGLSIFPF